MPSYDHRYRLQQQERVGRVARVLEARNRQVRAGRVIPDHGALPIGVGRQISATVMFLDICGSSDLGSDDPVQQRASLSAMTLFFSEMIRIVEDHGGTVEKNTGDGLMAYFAAGQGGFSAPQTALSAALTMSATAEDLIGPVLERMGLGRFRFRVCLDHGPVTIAELGTARGFRSIVAIGTTANAASKMLAIADADSVFIGEAVLLQLEPDWQAFATERFDTRWTYSSDGRPYPCYRFTGRWTR